MSDLETQADSAVTIARYQGSDSGITIKVEDRKSGAYVSVRMTMADFALAVTGLGHTDAHLHHARNLQHWGKKQVLTHVPVNSSGAPSRNSKPEEKALKDWCRQVQLANCPNGFEFSHGSFTNQGVYNMVFSKWE